MKDTILLALFLLPSFSFSFIFPSSTRRPAFRTRLAVLTGPEGKAASSPKEDLELTFQIISDFIKENDNGVYKEEDDVIIAVEEEEEDEEVAKIAAAKQKTLHEIKELLSSIPKAAPKKVVKKHVQSHHDAGYTMKREPHINAHLSNLGHDDEDEHDEDGQQRVDVALYDDFSVSVATQDEQEQEGVIEEEDVLKAASDFFAGDGDDGGEDIIPFLNMGKPLEEEKEETEDVLKVDVAKAAQDFFTGDISDDVSSSSSLLEEQVLEETKDFMKESDFLTENMDASLDSVELLEENKVERRDIMDLIMEQANIWEEMELSDVDAANVEVPKEEEKKEITEQDVIQARTDFFSDTTTTTTTTTVEQVNADSVQQSLQNDDETVQDNTQEEQDTKKAKSYIAWDDFQKPYELESASRSEKKTATPMTTNATKEKAKAKAFDAFEDFGSEDGRGFRWM